MPELGIDMAIGDDDGGGESLWALDRIKLFSVDIGGRLTPGPRCAYLVSIAIVGTPLDAYAG